MFAVAKSTADVKNQFDKGLMSLCMGMENGSPVEGKLENLKYFQSRGVRYITLTHGKDNHISDSSYDTTHTWKGLSPFGKQVVAEMNRLGIMVDISHVSDEAFYQVMKISKAPAIASHSSCRAYTPGFERNISDDMIKLLAKNGGVIMINFGSSFLSDVYRQEERRQQKSLDSLFKLNNLTPRDSSAETLAQQYRQSHPLPTLTVADVVEHIDHVVQLAGVDHVGFGSDFDGVGDSLPIGIKDVSMYPNIIHGLLKRGYAEKDIEKICGGNLLRVWGQVEKKAKELQAKQ
jgi:membrane dipeptidase